MKITVTINAEPIEVDYVKSEVGEDFSVPVPESNPPVSTNGTIRPVVTKVTKYQEKITAFDREFEITRTTTDSHSGKRQFFQFNGYRYETIEQLVHALSNF